MHNPHDPLGSIRADSVGASRAFRVFFVGYFQLLLPRSSLDIALPD